MKKKILLLIFSLFCLNTIRCAQQQNNPPEGSWKGTLKTPSGNLTMVIHLKYTDGILTSNLDVPAQKAINIQATNTRVKNDSLLIEFKMMMAAYRGLYKKDSSLITGLWEQNNFVFPLRLIPVADSAGVKHNEPSKPYPYDEEEVFFDNANAHIKLAGTFTFPKGKGSYPAVVLISGSGPQNRNEELLGHKPFLIIADALTRAGIAVLRFDDRGTGNSSGDYSKATTFDFSTDAEAALNYLVTRKEVDKKRIGLLGHSEGGMIAPMVAARQKNVAFIVLLAAPGVKGADLLVSQSRALALASGIGKERVDSNIMINRAIFRLALSDKAYAADSIALLMKLAGLTESMIKSEQKKVMSPWLKYMLAFDPATYISQTHCPALNGKKDLQVPWQDNLEAIEVALKKSGNKNYTMKAYEGLNHLFQHCATGLPGEYASIQETISAEVLKDIGDWINNLKH